MTNIIGNLYKVTSFGESHGKVIGCIIDGCPSGINFKKKYIQYQLNRRRPGSSKYVTPRNEADKLIVISGIFQNKTTGTPIGVIVRNKNCHSFDYKNIGINYRPGHADYTYDYKYNIRDFNGGGRSSARVTIALVIAGSLARYIILDFFGINVSAYLFSIGNIKIPLFNNIILTPSNYFIPNNFIILTIEKYLHIIIKQHDSIGAIISCLITNIICGIGEPLFRKISSELSKNIMSLNAVKAIEFGIGTKCSSSKGSTNNDIIYDNGFLSNNSGGVLGGITTGQDINIKVHIKPTASISLPQLTINNRFQNSLINIKGRHDPCVAIRAVPIIEAIVSITILDLLLSHRLVKFF